MPYKVFPEGYDPAVAAGPPEPWATKHGMTWTPEETQQHREMESNAVWMDERPFNQWCMWYDSVPNEDRPMLIVTRDVTPGNSFVCVVDAVSERKGGLLHVRPNLPEHVPFEVLEYASDREDGKIKVRVFVFPEADARAIELLKTQNERLRQACDLFEENSADAVELYEVLLKVDKWLDGWCPSATCCASSAKDLHDLVVSVIRKPKRKPEHASGT